MDDIISRSNTRIARNTVIVYAKLAVTMVVGLLTSRYILQALGASDYGLYSVVGGVLAMISFVSASLSASTTRFLNCEMGKRGGNMNTVFNACLLIHIGLALLILLLAETAGVYYVQNILNVAPGKEGDAMFCFQVSTVVARIGIVNTPYSGLCVAFEKFNVVAAIAIASSFVRLAMVLALFVFEGDVLRIYAVFMSLNALLQFAAYHWYGHRQWPGILRWNMRPTRGRYRDILVYNNYNLLSTAALMIRDQGANIVINFFFSTTINAAYAISRTVQMYVNTFTGSFDSAAAPQITQALSGGEQYKSEHLTHIIGRLCMLSMELAFFPLMVELGYLLRLWLGDYPGDALHFCRLTLMLVFVGATSAGIVQYINASGKVKWFKVQFAVLYLMCIPAGFYIYTSGGPATSMLLLFIISDALSRVNQLILMRVILGFNSWRHIREAYMRPLCVAAIMTVFILTLKDWGALDAPPPSDTARLANIVLTLAATLATVYFVGLRRDERPKVVGLARKMLHL